MSSSIKALPLNQRIYLHGELMNHGILPSCMTCKHATGIVTSTREDEIECTLNSMIPPLDVIIVGCECWKQDAPF